MNDILIIGGGPAGLMAAEILATAGKKVHLYERKPSLGRKFLMAGRGGLNLTHSEDMDAFLKRYAEREADIAPMIRSFTPAQLRQWCEELGQETFIGSSGRVFPKAMKASPLLRAWIARLSSLGVEFNLQKTWTGWNEDYSLRFIGADGTQENVKADAVLLALGGASWPSLGSDGAWTNYLPVPIAPLRPANCGFCVSWSDYMKAKAGQPLKNIVMTHKGQSVPGEIMIGENGIEGGAVYALSAPIREEIALRGKTEITIDLRPSLSVNDIAKKLTVPKGRQSLSTYLNKALGFSSLQTTLLHECGADLYDVSLANTIKALPLTLTAPYPIDRAISTAGGIPFEELDENFMLRACPGIFAAGEMLDWEAPTGGYLLQGTFATAYAAASGIIRWLGR